VYCFYTDICTYSDLQGWICDEMSSCAQYCIPSFFKDSTFLSIISCRSHFPAIICFVLWFIN